MKNLIITDLHKRSGIKVIEEQRRISDIERVFVLGDYDVPGVVEELFDLDIPHVVLAGNHDYPFMRDAMKLFKGREVDFKKFPDYLPLGPDSYWAYVAQWMNKPKLREFAQKSIEDFENEERFQYEFETKAGKVVCVHASIFDDSDIRENLRIVDDVNTQDEPYQLWARMHNALGQVNEPIITGTFEMMKDPSLDIWMMFRGHDWGQKLYTLDRKSARFSNYETHWNPLEKKLEFKLSPDKCYIASFGSYSQGQYGIFDDEKLTLEFHNPERRDAWG